MIRAQILAQMEGIYFPQYIFCTKEKSKIILLKYIAVMLRPAFCPTKRTKSNIDALRWKMLAIIRLTMQKRYSAIAKTSYPFVTKDEMVKTLAEHGVEAADITEDELLTAVQNAIWYFANGNDNVIAKPYSGTWYYHNESDTAYYDEESNKYSECLKLTQIETVKTNIENVYNYLIKIAPEDAPDGGIVLNGVTAHPLSTGTSGAVDVLLRFELKNDRHGGITLDEKDVLTLTANNQIFPCSEWKNEGNGTYSVMLQGVTAEKI